MEIRWLGHSAFEIKLGGKTILTDPFISGNPKAGVTLDQITKVDYILLSHGHFDHVGDTVALCKKCGAKLIAPPELFVALSKQGAEGQFGNPGGWHDLGGVRVIMTSAVHSSGLGLDIGDVSYAGAPVGFVIEGEGKRVYFAGDTALAADLKLVIGEYFKPDVALLPVSGVFVMDPDQAAVAASWIKPRVVIPMHYNSLPFLPEVDTEGFSRLVTEKAPGTRTVVLQPGESYKE
ncbi:MAG: metal-dependent hydrolase [Dehalococcoidia bacterium]|nr:metal-dependent hydrolase [Dehalococcoidia bacterium]